MRLGLILLLAAQAAQAEPDPQAGAIGTVTRGPMEVIVRVKGTIRAEDVFRLTSTIEGRVEEVNVSPLSWMQGGKAMAYVLNKEMSAMMDAKASTPGQILEQRWQTLYKPTPIGCSTECFVLQVFARKKAWIQPETLLFEVARKLRLVGRVRPQDSHWVQKGQLLTYWPVKEPQRRVQTRVDRFVLDVQGERVEPGGTLTSLLDSKRYLDPGTEWEGRLVALAKKDVLRVPTQALISYNGETFLTIRVSTGITAREITEITSGVSPRDRFLVIETSGTCLQRHAPAYQARPEKRSAKPDPEDERLRRRREELGIQKLPKENPDEFDGEFPSDLHGGGGDE